MKPHCLEETLVCLHSQVQAFLRSVFLGERGERDRGNIFYPPQLNYPLSYTPMNKWVMKMREQGKNKYSSKSALLPQSGTWCCILTQGVHMEQSFLQPQRKGTIYHVLDSQGLTQVFTGVTGLFTTVKGTFDGVACTTSNKVQVQGTAAVRSAGSVQGWPSESHQLSCPRATIYVKGIFKSFVFHSGCSLSTENRKKNINSGLLSWRGQKEWMQKKQKGKEVKNGQKQQLQAGRREKYSKQ